MGTGGLVNRVHRDGSLGMSPVEARYTATVCT